jgi:hypothetical protein
VCLVGLTVVHACSDVGGMPTLASDAGASSVGGESGGGVAVGCWSLGLPGAGVGQVC